MKRTFSGGRRLFAGLSPEKTLKTRRKKGGNFRQIVVRLVAHRKARVLRRFAMIQREGNRKICEASKAVDKEGIRAKTSGGLLDKKCRLQDSFDQEPIRQRRFQLRGTNAKA